MQATELSPEENSSLQLTAAKGLAWTGLAQAITQLFMVTTTIILARFLLPSDFGLISMANIIIGFAGLINGLGLGAAIIQKSDLEERHLNSVFVSNIVLGVILFLLLVILSPAIALFYNNQEVQPILCLLAVSFILSGASATHNAILTKRMKYNVVAMVSLVSVLLQSITAISLAITHWGSWTLVFSQWVGGSVTLIGLWYWTDWRPRFQFDRLAFRELFGFGANVLGSNILGYTSANIDNLFVGRFLGVTPLGYYDLAFRMASLPRQKFLGIVHQVMFPVFSLVQEDNARLRSAYVKLITYISLVTFPTSIGLMIIAPDLIPLLYTEKWEPAILPLQILCVGAVITTIGFPTGLIFKAKGKPDIELKMTVISVLLLVILLLMGIKFGLIGVALAVSLKSLIMIWVVASKTNELIDLKSTPYIKAFIPAINATLIMVVPLLLLQNILHTSLTWSHLTNVIITIGAGSIIYFSSISLLNPSQGTELVLLIRQVLQTSMARIGFFRKILAE